MSMTMERMYYIDTKHIRYCYPYEVQHTTKNLGVLEKYENVLYTREYIDKIIANLIIKHPYIDNSRRLEVNVMCTKPNSFYHMLVFTNDNCKEQVKGSTEIKFEL